MLLGDQKVAIFEGTYSEIQGNQLVENLKPRRRGYKIGDTFGGYKIDTIYKTHATLSAITNNDITLTVSKTPASNKIEKSENRLIQKSKVVLNKAEETTFSSSLKRRASQTSIEQKGLNSETVTPSRASRARRTEIQKKGLNEKAIPSSRAIGASRARRARSLNRAQTKTDSPRTKQPPAISTPGAESSDPSNTERLQ